MNRQKKYNQHRREYEKYIGSDAWAEKRRHRLEIDGYKCVVCKSDAVEVHHLHYDTLRNENPLTDLVSTCRRCHKYFDTIERFIRYKRRQYAQSEVNEIRQQRKDYRYGMENAYLPTEISLSDGLSQRTSSRSPQPFCEIDQADIIEAGQDGFRFRGNGTH